MWWLEKIFESNIIWGGIILTMNAGGRSHKICDVWWKQTEIFLWWVETGSGVSLWCCILLWTFTLKYASSWTNWKILQHWLDTSKTSFYDCFVSLPSELCWWQKYLIQTIFRRVSCWWRHSHLWWMQERLQTSGTDSLHTTQSSQLVQEIKSVQKSWFRVQWGRFRKYLKKTSNNIFIHPQVKSSSPKDGNYVSLGSPSISGSGRKYSPKLFINISLQSQDKLNVTHRAVRPEPAQPRWRQSPATLTMSRNISSLMLRPTQSPHQVNHTHTVEASEDDTLPAKIIVWLIN